MSGSPAEIVALEGRTSRAWRAAEEAAIGGWRLYSSSGFSGRINSCWPLEEPGLEPADAMRRVEDWYRDRDLPCRFKVVDTACRPAGLVEVLRDRGYRPAHETLAMVGAVAAAPDPRAIVANTPTADFQSVFFASSAEEGDARERLEALSRVPRPRAFVVVQCGGAPAAVGAAAVEGAWVGIFAMRTSRAYRRQGLARGVFNSLLAWSADVGAERAWLQVEAVNAPALGLYRSAGFTDAYAYRYWMK